MMTAGELREFFKNDRFVRLAGIEIESVSPGGAVCGVALRDEHLNAMNNPQGGLIYTLADFTFAVAANAGESDAITLNSDFHFVGAARGGRLVATALVKSAGRRVCVYEVSVSDDTGAVVAFGSFTGYLRTRASL